MSLNESDVSRIAELAKLQVPSDAHEAVLAKLNSIFGLVETMQAVNTQGVEPLYHPCTLIMAAALPLREDEVIEVNTTNAANTRDIYQALASETEDGLYLVPKVIE